MGEAGEAGRGNRQGLNPSNRRIPHGDLSQEIRPELVLELRGEAGETFRLPHQDFWVCARKGHIGDPLPADRCQLAKKIQPGCAGGLLFPTRSAVDLCPESCDWKIDGGRSGQAGQLLPYRNFHRIQYEIRLASDALDGFASSGLVGKVGSSERFQSLGHEIDLEGFLFGCR